MTTPPHRPSGGFHGPGRSYYHRSLLKPRRSRVASAPRLSPPQSWWLSTSNHQVGARCEFEVSCAQWQEDAWRADGCELDDSLVGGLKRPQWALGALDRAEPKEPRVWVRCTCRSVADTAVTLRWEQRWVPRSNLYLRAGDVRRMPVLGSNPALADLPLIRHSHAPVSEQGCGLGSARGSPNHAARRCSPC